MSIINITPEILYIYLIFHSLATALNIIHTPPSSIKHYIFSQGMVE